MGAALGAVTGLASSFLGGSGRGKHAVQPHQVDRSKFEIEGAKGFQDQAAAQQRLLEGRSRGAASATQQLLGDLSQQAQGRGPSLAEAQLKQAQDRSLAQQLAAVQATRPGGNPALARRSVMQQAAQQAQQTAGQAAQARMQEQLQAQQMLGQVAAQESQLVDNLTKQFMGMGFDIANAQTAARARAEELQMGANRQAQQLAQESHLASQGRQHEMLQGGIKALGEVGAGASTSGDGGGGGGMMAMLPALMASDKNSKKAVKNASKDVDTFLSALSAKSYKYKDTKKPGTAKGTNYGIIAQDLEKSKVGKSMVQNTPNGKMVDMQKGFGAVLAAQARMNERMVELEKVLGKGKKNGRG